MIKRAAILTTIRRVAVVEQPVYVVVYFDTDKHTNDNIKEIGETKAKEYVNNTSNWNVIEFVNDQQEAVDTTIDHIYDARN
jgi:hypothetical protein